MSLIPDEYLHPRSTMNFAPMVDFLFLTLTIFAVLAFSKSTSSDTSIDLAHSSKTSTALPSHRITLSILREGGYVWGKGGQQLPIPSVTALKKALASQKKNSPGVFLQIDDQAQWDVILPAILAIEEAGLTPYPIN